MWRGIKIYSRSNSESPTKKTKQLKGQNEITSDSIDKYIIKIDDIFYLNLPQVGSLNIKISEKEISKDWL